MFDKSKRKNMINRIKELRTKRRKETDSKERDEILSEILRLEEELRKIEFEDDNIDRFCVR